MAGDRDCLWGCVMRRIACGLLVLGTGLGITLLARERHGPYEGQSTGEASRQLLAEHEIILHVLNAVQAEAHHGRQGFDMDQNLVRQFLDFSRNFIDRCHHAKEERYYFPAAQVYIGQRVYGLIDELETEHTYGRSILDEIDYLLTGDASAVAQPIAERLTAYVDMLRRHIRKENEQLYRKAGTFLPRTEERALALGFDRVENVDLGPGFHERYHNLAEELSESSSLR